MLRIVNYPHWTSDTPIDAGWYWYRDRLHPAMMIRIDVHSVVDSQGEFDGTQATDLVGDWWSARIKAFV